MSGEQGTPEREQRDLETLFATMAQGVVYQGADGRILDANPAAERVLGLSLAQMTGRDSHDPRWRAVRGDGSPMPAEEHPVMVALRTGKPTGNTLMGVYHPREDIHRWLLVAATPEFRDGESRPYRACTTFTDITLRHNAEEALRNSERRFRAIIESSPMGVHTYDLRDGDRLVFAEGNDAADKMLGVSHAELVGKTLEEAFPGLVETPIPERYRRICREGTTMHEQQVAYEDEHVVGAFDVHAFQTSPGSMAVFFLDVTEREKQAAERARLTRQVEESAERYRTLFEGASDAIFLMHGDRFVDCNAQALRMFGCRSEEIIGSGPSVLSPEFQPDGRASEEKALAFITEALEGRPQRFEWRHRRCDDSEFDAEVGLNRIDVGGEALLQAIVRDLTKRRAAERERKLIEARARRQQQLEAVGTLAAGVAHEINNPLTGMINYAQLIDNRAPEDERLRHYAQRIVKEGERVSEIVRNLLTFSRQESQTPGPADVSVIVNDAVALVRTIFRKDRVQLDIDIEPGLPATRCRSRQVQQILMNLLTNARDALTEAQPGGGTTADRLVRIRARRWEDNAGRTWNRVTVSDRGPGIPPQLRERIFEPFFTTKPRDRGTGLGLSVSYGLAQDNGGQLSVESEEGVGTRFHLDLPPVLDGEPRRNERGER